MKVSMYIVFLSACVCVFGPLFFLSVLECVCASASTCACARACVYFWYDPGQ